MFVDDAAAKKFVNEVLRELHDHYKSTYRSYHERLGVVVSIVGEFHRVICLHEQFLAELSLYTRSGRGMQLASQKEPINTVHDLRHSVKM
ncbi:hypothetical protein AAVH_17719 [Aphelenchoides avenae]|nr:hypothetical protein AAVH_17719 [Aphelenchus avenae]